MNAIVAWFKAEREAHDRMLKEQEKAEARMLVKCTSCKNHDCVWMYGFCPFD